MIIATATRAQFEQVKERLRANEGMDVSDGDLGSLSKAGVRAEYQYDGQQLRIEITHKPFFMTFDLVEAKVMDGLRYQGLQPRKG